MTSFEDLVGAATTAPFSGWDFSWLDSRLTWGTLPWSYRRLVAERAANVDTMLDMGTGGGEWLSKLSARPARTVATEAWPPNVGVAATQLRPLGIPVVQDEGAPDNGEQEGSDRGRMPFRSGAFSLIANRHESFCAREVLRVLAPGATFITQQVDLHNDDELRAALGLDVPDEPESWLPLAQQQLSNAGFTVEQALRGEERNHFHDVAALIYYLRVVAWAIPEYSLDACIARLRALHDTPDRWPLVVRQRRFLVVARKPGPAG
jgi:SAM-dependent methyltransferase